MKRFCVITVCASVLALLAGCADPYYGYRYQTPYRAYGPYYAPQYTPYYARSAPRYYSHERRWWHRQHHWHGHHFD